MDIDNPEAVLGRGWDKSTVRFEVPHGQKASPPPRETCMFDAPGVLHRSIATLVREEFSKPSAAAFHYTPFSETWANEATGKNERMYSEMFSSEAFIKAHNELQASPREPDCDLPRAIAGLCLMSDSAHLTDTGNAHIHPFNVAFANESMYSRGKPSNHSVHPVMHLPALSDTELQNFVQKLHGKGKAKGNPIFTQCRREYFQGALKLLFNKDFWDMYAHGDIVDCADGVRRRLYLRLFVYSADYPEKVLVATIRDGGGCPCPRCLVQHADLCNMGTADDLRTRESQRRVDDSARQSKVKKARQFLRKGYAVTYAGIDKELKDESYVPVENAFSVQDGSVRLNVFDLLVVDLMHEIELGVWVALLAHLIRILYSLDPEKVTLLNTRYGLTAARSSRTHAAIGITRSQRSAGISFANSRTM
ncbi:hypothetical protein AURDEDRAFT_69087 [Auricularia subglabra TFB-10046 SS5]|nr:hypothetical protein AURDEDRAFT_69087 [Auricularia subglabra TFB-10046 SS5]